MTNEEWAVLTPRERNIHIAEKVMGWERFISADHTNGKTPLARSLGIIYGWKHNGKSMGIDVPNYITNPTLAASVEDEIERRGLKERYSEVLCDICWQSLYSIKPGDEFSYFREDSLWSVIRATPDQRCLAALRSVS